MEQQKISNSCSYNVHSTRSHKQLWAGFSHREQWKDKRGLVCELNWDSSFHQKCERIALGLGKMMRKSLRLQRWTSKVDMKEKKHCWELIYARHCGRQLPTFINIIKLNLHNIILNSNRRKNREIIANIYWILILSLELKYSENIISFNPLNYPVR